MLIKKKNIIYLSLFSILLFQCISFTSCNGDNKKNSNNTEVYNQSEGEVVESVKENKEETDSEKITQEVVADEKEDTNYKESFVEDSKAQGSELSEEKPIIQFPVGKYKEYRNIGELKRKLRSPSAVIAARTTAWLINKEVAQLVIPALIKSLEDYRKVKVITKEKDSDYELFSNVETVSSYAKIALTKIGNPAINPMITALPNLRKGEGRLNGAIVLGSINERGFDSLLEILISNQKSNIRATAAEAFGEIGNKRAVDKLIIALQDKDRRVRINVLKSLEKMRVRGIADKIIPLMKNDEKSIREISSRLMIRLADKNSISALIDALKNDNNYKVRMNAAVALGAFKDTQVVKILIRALNDREQQVRRKAVTSLNRVVNKSFVLDLKIARRRCHPDVQKTVSSILDRFTFPDTVKDIKTALGRTPASETGNRLRLIHALGQTGDSKAVPLLLKAIKSRSQTIKNAVLDAAGQLRAAGNPRDIIPLLKQSDYKVRALAVQLLGGTYHSAAIEPLISALKDKNQYVRTTAGIALKRLTNERDFGTDSEKWKKWWKDNEKNVTKDSGKFDKPGTYEYYHGRLSHPDSKVRSMAVSNLVHYPDKDVFDEIVNMLQDESAGVKMSAIYALRDLDDKRAIKPLIDLLDDEDVKSWVTPVLQKLSGKKIPTDKKKWTKWFERNGQNL